MRITKRSAALSIATLIATMGFGVTAAHASAPQFDSTDLNHSLNLVWEQVVEVAKHLKSGGLNYLWAQVSVWAKTLFNAFTNP